MIKRIQELLLQVKQERLLSGRSKGKGNKGASLVEVLVSVAVLSIICIPLFKGFGTSSVLNKRAHHTQLETAYAQEVLEDMKRLSVKDFTADVLAATDKNGNPAGRVTENKDEALAAKFPGYDAELFTVVTCEVKDIEIGGKTYALEAVYDPLPYSSYSSTELKSAADINVFGFSEVQDIDGLKYPVISNEINKYEGSKDTAASYLNDLWWMLPDGVRGSVSFQELYTKTDKTVDVIIKDDGGSAIKVICDVSYEAPDYSVKRTYNVYNSSFELKELKDDAGNFVSYLSGGKIYIFAKAYQDQTGTLGGGMINDNTIRITNYHTGQPLSIYLVRGYYSGASAMNPNPADKRGVNFDHVYLSDGSATKLYSSLAPGEEPIGEVLSDSGEGFPNMDFRTNIKGKGLNRVLTTEDMEQTIGKDVSKLRCYQLTVTLTDSDSGKIAAQTVSAKEN